MLALIGATVATPARGRPWALPLPVRLLLVLIHLRTNLTTRALAALFSTSQSTVDRVLHQLVPILAKTLEHDTTKAPDGPWIIDGTLIPVHDQSITAISKNYRRSINSQILIDAQSRTVIAVGAAWPGNRNDVIVARHTLAHHTRRRPNHPRRRRISRHHHHHRAPPRQHRPHHR